ncbi:MAG: stage III sporulation protein AF [Firmicutes bacterium]|nr:stage III sporulation protein AF [Bacillota bacterium]
MAAIGDWLKVLIVVVLLGNLVDFILPKGDLKRYGGLVVGLVILATIITPLWGWMRQVHSVATLRPSEWTNSSSGFRTVVASEELHQAEAIVLSMPHIQSCHLTLGADGVVTGVVRTGSTPVSEKTVRHYVDAALQVTMGGTPTVRLTVEQAATPTGTREKRQP